MASSRIVLKESPKAPSSIVLEEFLESGYSWDTWSRLRAKEKEKENRMTEMEVAEHRLAVATAAVERYRDRVHLMERAQQSWHREELKRLERLSIREHLSIRERLSLLLCQQLVVAMQQEEEHERELLADAQARLEKARIELQRTYITYTINKSNSSASGSSANQPARAGDHLFQGFHRKTQQEPDEIDDHTLLSTMDLPD